MLLNICLRTENDLPQIGRTIIGQAANMCKFQLFTPSNKSWIIILEYCKLIIRGGKYVLC